MVTGYIQDAKEHIEAAIENLEKFIAQADPQNEDEETTLNAIDYIRNELQNFWDEHQGVFYEITGG